MVLAGWTPFRNLMSVRDAAGFSTRSGESGGLKERCGVRVDGVRQLISMKQLTP